MAVELKYSVCEEPNCKAINFRELTGPYDVTDNPGGWGTPNEELTDAVTATLIMTNPSGVTYPSYDVLALGFPKEDSFVSKEIQASDIDASLTTFVDGFWSITYTVTTGTTTYAQTKTFFFYCNIKKEVCKLIAELRLSDCTCNSEKVVRACQMHAYLMALGYAVGLGDTVSANELYATLQNLIDCSIC
tara:strand:- start:239 stop:805 length:567 start_codon:yes stop_codon:yes gene_type:complete